MRVPASPFVFAAGQLQRLGGLIHLARDLTGDFFRLGLEEAQKIPYEVRTAVHLGTEEIRRDGVLADIARYQYTEPRFGRKKDIYRVNLQDHNILHSLRRDPGSIRFSPLLLYVLTHEIVHVIRFVKFLAPFHQDESERFQEERQVHGVTRRILARMPLRGLKAVLCEYDRHLEAEPPGG